MGSTYLDKLRALPNAETTYYLAGKIIAALGLGILIANWFRLSDFIGWILLVLGIAFAIPPSIKIFSNLKKSTQQEKKARR